MRSTLSVSLLVAFFMMGCGSSSNNSGAINNGSGFLTPQGSYSLQQTLDPSDTSRYTLGCLTTGSTTAVIQIDPRLRTNQTFSYSAQGVFSGSSFSFTAQETITGITATDVFGALQVFTVSGVPGVSPGQTGSVDCNLSNGQYNCTYTPSVVNNFGALANCTFTNPTSVTSTLDKGVFQLQSGQTVNGFRTNINIAGGFSCGGQASNGRMTAVGITTNDIASPDSGNFCGGSSVFAALNATNGDGSTMLAVSVERTAYSGQ